MSSLQTSISDLTSQKKAARPLAFCLIPLLYDLPPSPSFSFSFSSLSSPRNPTRIFEWPPEAMRDRSRREQDPGPGGAIPQGISHDEASQEDAASGCTALSQSSQVPSPEETREEAHQMFDDRVLPQEYSPDGDALREEGNERLETPHGYIDWGSKPIDGSSCYSTEDEGFQVGPSITS